MTEETSFWGRDAALCGYATPHGFISDVALMKIGPGNAAMLEAAIAFRDRDRRRIKREMNKAFAKAKVKSHG